MYEFPVDGPVAVEVRLAAGRCDVIAEDRDTASVDIAPQKANDERSSQLAAETTAELTGNRLVVRTPEASGVGWLVGRRNGRLRITVRVPRDSSLVAKLASADLSATGRLGTAGDGSAPGLGVNSASGNVTAEYVAGDVRIDSASGDVRIGHVEGSVTAKTASGDLRIDHVGGGLTNNSASGDTRLGIVNGDVRIHSASGDLVIGAARTGKIKVSTASGDVKVGVPAGTGVWLDLNTASGSTTSDLTVGAETPLSGHDLELRIGTASGDIQVHRVPAID